MIRTQKLIRVCYTCEGRVLPARLLGGEAFKGH